MRPTRRAPRSHHRRGHRTRQERPATPRTGRGTGSTMTPETLGPCVAVVAPEELVAAVT